MGLLSAKGYLFMAILSMPLVSLWGCSKTAPVKEMPEVNLIGKWRAPVDPEKSLKTEYGPARILLEFKKTGTLSVNFEVMDSPGGSGVINLEEPYRFHNHILTSEAIDRGEKIFAKLNDDGHLVLQLQDGELYELVKIERKNRDNDDL